ncbi:hypothetical protein DPEC_G00185250 [Dallia pectoralis]|uniref:Uncharacterized protein n=1 Tax=Dallia pectoralis TaxID=75939 RepID=A0ACC2GBJ5_DALPE|nr:hypothetical protein DPEC_G00185250 [Dallia pectoralis]
MFDVAADVTEGANSTTFVSERSWTQVERLVLVAVLVLEMVLGVIGNSLTLLVKIMCRDRFPCKYWVPFVSLTLSDLCSSLLLTSGSLLAILTKGQRSPWCEVVSLLKFVFITSSIGSIAILCVQRATGVAYTRSAVSHVMAMACPASWVTGVVFGSIPVVYHWIRYDQAEMLCAVFWMNSYSDMLVYILCTFSICIFLPFLLIISCSLVTAAGCGTSRDSDPDDLCSVTPLVVVFYLFCYTPFAVSELILLGSLDLSPAPYWIRTLSSVMSYLDCVLNPIIYSTNRDFREAGLALFWSTCRKSISLSDPVLTVMNRLEM